MMSRASEFSRERLTIRFKVLSELETATTAADGADELYEICSDIDTVRRIKKQWASLEAEGEKTSFVLTSNHE